MSINFTPRLRSLYMITKGTNSQVSFDIISVHISVK